MIFAQKQRRTSEKGRCAVPVLYPFLSTAQRPDNLRSLFRRQAGIVFQNLGQILAPLHSAPHHTAQQLQLQRHASSPPNISAAISSSSSSKRVSCVGCAAR